MRFIDAIEQNLNLNDRKTFFVIFTIIFMAMVFIVFISFFYNGRGFVYYGDGIEQYLITLTYFGEYVRLIISNFFHGNFTIPMWDNNIGFGADIITVIHHYAMGDPLTLLSVLFPAKWTELAYDIIIILRLYLAGIFFALYCFKMKMQGFPILIGVFVYIFCGYNLVAFMLPLFLIPVVLLPLLFIGIEKIFNGEKPYLFIITVFISAMSDFYYFYLLSLLILTYAAIRVFFIYKENKIKNIFKCLLRFSIYYFIGFLAASILFVPNIIALFDSPRSSVEHAPYLFYTGGYYKLFLFSFITIFHNFIYDYFYQLKMGYPVLALFAVLLIFIKRKDFAQLKILFVFFVLVAAFPIAGKVFNGFSYITNRWIFAFSFLIAFIITAALPKIIKINKKEFLAMLIFTICYAIVFIILFSSLSIYVLELKFSFIFLGLCLLLLFFLYKKPLPEFKAYLALFVLLLANIAFNANFLYSEKGWNYSSLYLKQGSAYNTLTNNAQTLAKQLETADFARFEQNSFNGESVIENAAMLNQVKGMSYYFSLNNPFIYQYFKEMGIASERDFRYAGLDGRAMTGTLANSHYFIAALGNEAFVPYGHGAAIGQYRASNKTIYQAYQNKNALPFGYTYSHYLPRAIYDRFSSIRKQQIQTQAAVLEENLDSDFKILNEPIFREIPIKFQAKATPNISVYGNIFTIVSESGVISFSFKGLPNSETYLSINNIKLLTPYNPQEYLYARAPKTIKTIPLLGVWSPWYIDRNDFIVNTGFNTEAIDEILLVFNPNSRFSIDNMEIISLPIGAQFDAEIEKLKQDYLQNVQILTNKIKGSINLSSNKILLLSIPYTKGWKAFVNGKETPLLRANTMFSALPLKAGSYDIELRYRTPGILLGLALSCMGFLLFAVLLYMNKKEAA